jgi:hypothetical protein
MKLRRLVIDRMPGIDRPFELGELGPGLNIIVGPNGIGKSQLCMAVRALLWRERGLSGGLSARAIFLHEGETWTVQRDGSRHVWQRDGVEVMAPNLPGERLEGCFFLGLRDLLDDSDRAGRDLAGEIRRQMAGGFDLEAVHRSLGEAVPVRSGRRENKDLASSDSEIRRAKKSQADIARREADLGSLELRARTAEQAAKRIPRLETALDLHRLRMDASHCRDELATLPAALANLDGREAARLDRLDEELRLRRAEREAAEAALAESREALRATRLGEVVEAAALATWRERSEKLAELERALEIAQSLRKTQFEAVAQRRQWLGAEMLSDPDVLPDDVLSVGDDASLFEFLRESQQAAVQSEAIRQRLSLLAAREFSAEDARRLELLNRSISQLREWLRVPDPERTSVPANFRPSRGAFLGIGIPLVVAGLLGIVVGSNSLASGLGSGAIGLGVGLVIASFFQRRRIGVGDSAELRAIAEKRFPEAIESPRDWSIEAVDARLHELEDEAARLGGNEKRARDRLVERGQLEENLNGLERRGAERARRRAALSASLGLESLRPDVELVDLAQGLIALRESVAAARAAESTANELGQSRNELLESLTDSLEALGEAAPSDAASSRASVHSLEERDRTLRSAIVDGQREAKNCDRLFREIERLETSRNEIFKAAGLVYAGSTGSTNSTDNISHADEAPDVARRELARILGELPRYAELETKRRDLASRLERASAELELAGESALIEVSADQLAEQCLELEQAKAGRDELMAQITNVRRDVMEARNGHTIEEAIARRNRVLDSLRDRRDQALTARAGQFLIEEVRREHETNQMPRVLERARNRFGLFTHHRYELRVSPDDGGSFVAIDTDSGLGLRPEQLSDGTRAQLILAARLAFAEEAEQGADLPIFLDEAMDHSDPGRFHAIACSLARMVMNDERQIFYLSNDPTDVERFRIAFDEVGCQQFETFDLGLIRGHVARVDGPGQLSVLPLATIPSPGELEAPAYGAKIGVAPLDLQADPRSHHLYYVLNQDLLVLHELLVARIETIGQWSNLHLSGSDFAKDIITGSAAGAQLTCRIALLEAFSFAWREGRGRPVGRAEIEESQAVSEKYLEALIEIAAECGGDASQILAVLHGRKDSRLRGYRVKSTEDLERFFQEAGYVDEKPVLSKQEIVERVLGTPSATALTPKISAHLVHEWWTLASAAIS